jgi:hypothetical protein
MARGRKQAMVEGKGDFVKRRYQTLVGGLMYLVKLRIDATNETATVVCRALGIVFG